MNTFRLTVSSPDGNLFDGEAGVISLRGADGDLAVMAGHVPFITSVQPGRCKITLPDESEKELTLDGGILTVAAGAVTLLSSSAEWA